MSYQSYIYNQFVEKIRQIVNQLENQFVPEDNINPEGNVDVAINIELDNHQALDRVIQLINETNDEGYSRREIIGLIIDEIRALRQDAEDQGSLLLLVVNRLQEENNTAEHIALGYYISLVAEIHYNSDAHAHFFTNLSERINSHDSEAMGTIRNNIFNNFMGLLANNIIAEQAIETVVSDIASTLSTESKGEINIDVEISMMLNDLAEIFSRHVEEYNLSGYCRRIEEKLAKAARVARAQPASEAIQSMPSSYYHFFPSFLFKSDNSGGPPPDNHDDSSTCSLQ
jgi:hypothetical protein